ncbi:MAG TPA: tripartite tricarboxylate transporter substrate-binding protein, partial [Burkholderiales bacterium]|nr:tripartite tricarboxylate transporter substrate-binding protein [Burkholderiales bacterium]
MKAPLGVWGIAAVSAFALGSAVHAQGYPAKNIVVVVPYPPGGGTDLFARVISQDIAKQFEKQVIVDNRSGANGNIGAEFVSKAAPDGHVLLYTASPIAVSRILSKN